MRHYKLPDRREQDSGYRLWKRFLWHRKVTRRAESFNAKYGYLNRQYFVRWKLEYSYNLTTYSSKLLIRSYIPFKGDSTDYGVGCGDLFTKCYILTDLYKLIGTEHFSHVVLQYIKLSSK